VESRTTTKPTDAFFPVRVPWQMLAVIGEKYFQIAQPPNMLSMLGNILGGFGS
jgi:hypothetical protein